MDNMQQKFQNLRAAFASGPEAGVIRE